MAAKPTIAVLQEDGYVDLAEALSFSVANTGDVNATLAFDLSSPAADLPASTSYQFEFVGARYEGRAYIKFAPDAPAVARKLVSIIKITHHC